MQHLPNGVSLLVCTYNGAALIAETLACLARQHTPGTTPWEVILVDNASTDGTANQARKTWKELGTPAPLHLLREPRPGKQYALETALGHVRYRHTCIVDDDNRLAPDYLQVGLEMLEAHPQIGVLGGQSAATFEEREPEWFAAFQHCYAVGPQLQREGGRFEPLPEGGIGRNVLWGAGMFVRTEVWQRLRAAGFKSLLTGRQGEKNLTAGEDDELCFAALLMGFEVWYSARLCLRHHMVAGRLTEAYRDRLFYASAYSTSRLNAYRNALWGNPAGSAAVNLLKDLGFIVRSLGQELLAPAPAASLVARMMRRHRLLMLKDTAWHFGRVQAYYEQVLRLRERLRALSPSSLPQPA